MKMARLLPRFREAYRSFGELENRESWSRAQMDAFQLQRLNKVWAHAIVYVPYYRSIQAELSLPRYFESLEEYTDSVPILQKSFLQTNSRDLLSERPQPGRWHRTSGSTGSPLTIFREHEAHHEMLRANYRYYRMWGHDVFDRMVFLWHVTPINTPGFTGKIKRGREYVEDKLRNRLRLAAHTLGPKDLQLYLEKIAAFKPSAIYSYSRAAYLLALEAKKQGFQCPSLKVITLTSEPASEHVVHVVQEGLGAPCNIEYGCVEFGFVAGQWPDRTLRVRDDLVLVETLARPEKLFDIVLTNLNNPSYPLLRYDIGDVTDQPIELAERGFSILGNISGRCYDLLYTPAGRCLHPIVVEDLFDGTYFKYVRRFQIHQRADYSILALVELHDPANVPNTAQLAKRLSVLVDGCPVEVKIVARIEQTTAGKHRNVLSELVDVDLPTP
jgi:phenylacetate-CoA ligase